MAAHPSFPAPPDLSKLLKFFASPSYDHTHAASVQQQQKQPSTTQRNRGAPGAERNTSPHLRHSSSAPTASSQRQRPPCQLRGTREARTSTHQDHRTKPTRAPEATRALGSATTTTTTAAAQRRRGSPPKEPASDWNGSTQIPATVAKPLKHQILDRTYMPPAPVVVDASGATYLMQRLSKTTISSQLKRHQADEEAALVAASAALAGAFERRSRHNQKQYKGTRLQGEADDEMAVSSFSAAVPSPPDSRARDGIQTLLMYRREVEKRLRMNPTHFPTQAAAGGDPY